MSVGRQNKWLITWLFVVCVSFSLTTGTLAAVDDGGLSIKHVRIEDQLKVHWAYFRQRGPFDQGSIHLGIRNSLLRPIRFAGLIVDGHKIPSFAIPDMKDLGLPKLVRKPGEVLWHTSLMEIVPPKGFTEYIIKFLRTPRKKTVRLRLISDNGGVLEADVTRSPEACIISFIGFAKALNKVYVYVENKRNTPLALRETLLHVNGRASLKPIERFPLVVDSKRKCVATFEPNPPLKIGERVFAEVITGEGTFGASRRAFSHFPLEVWRSTGDHKGQIAPDGMKGELVLDHWYDTHMEPAHVAAKMIPTLLQTWKERPSVLKYACDNQFALPRIAADYGDIMDGMKGHLQPLFQKYMGKYNQRDAHYLQALCRFYRDALAPSPLYGEMQLCHTVQSFPPVATLSPEEVRLRAYYLISRGCKGLSYRSSGLRTLVRENSEAVLEQVVRISQELIEIRDILRSGEFFDGIAKTSEPLVEASAICKGNEEMLLLLLNHDRQMCWPGAEMDMHSTFFLNAKPDPFDVSLQLPPNVFVSQIREVGHSNNCPSFEVSEGQLNFSVAGIKAVRLFRIGLSREQTSTNSPHQSLGSLRGRSEPDIQFPKGKQFIMTVGQEDNSSTQIDIPIQNVGGSDLIIHSVICPDEARVQASTSRQKIGAGEIASIKIAMRSKPKREVLTVYVRTNDPNEGKVKVLIGIRSPNALPIFFAKSKVVLRRTERGVYEGSVDLIDRTGGLAKVLALETTCPQVLVSRQSTKREPKRRMAMAFRDPLALSPPKQPVVLKLCLQTNGLLGAAIGGTDCGVLRAKVAVPETHVLEIPLVLDKQLLAEVVPPSVNFGLILPGKTAQQCVEVKFREGHSPRVTVGRLEGKFRVAKVVEATAGKWLIWIVCNSGRVSGLQRGKVVLSVYVQGKKEQLEIPCIALLSGAVKKGGN